MTEQTPRRDGSDGEGNNERSVAKDQPRSAAQGIADYIRPRIGRILPWLLVVLLITCLHGNKGACQVIAGVSHEVADILGMHPKDRGNPSDQPVVIQ
jgi:hypothetical protein